MSAFWLIPVGILLALALPAAVKRKSLIWFFVALILSFVGVMLPLFIFLFSSFIEPEWKGACAYGWLDCFILGKLALTPLVLLAIAALYALEILRVEKRTRRWIVIGIFFGAIVASVCFVFGMLCISPDATAPKWWLLVPFYVAVWYSIRAVQLIKASHFDFWTYFISLVGSLPFWLASWLWSRNLYESLPDKAPSDCFIVTAVGCGHESLVGPFIEVIHRGQPRRTNQQLITFWQLENLWQSRAPQCHQSFRRLYNRFGPFVAAQIKSPWVADTAYIAIKPVELVVRIAMEITRRARPNL